MTQATPDIEAVTLRAMRLPDDAEKLAQMWNASDDQWPGTVSDGVPITAQWVLDRELRQKSREVMVWETGDQIAGYCSLWDSPQEPNVTYIATLNVAPQYQKLSLGRRFLQYYVDRAVEIGSYRLDLHTWPGNLKAVPLYKKCGFFWMPGTSVHMLNFLPTILTMPATQPFFRQHDWYTSFKRALSQAEDDERWEGMKVFTYRFEAGGEQLTAWVDREARRVTALETGDLFAAALAPSQEPACGMAAALRWRVTNKRSAPMQLSLIATGDAALALDYRATHELAPGATIELEAPVQVAAEVAKQREHVGTPFVRSVLVIDGQVLELGTGMRPREAVEVQTEPRHVTLTPGVPQTVELRLRSRLAYGMPATVSIAPSPGLTSDTHQAELELAAGGFGGLRVTLCAEQSGVYQLPVTIGLAHEGGVRQLPAAVQTVFALAPGGVLGARVGDRLRLENDLVRLSIGKRGANLTVHTRDGRELLEETSTAAPPAYPNLFHETDFELSVVQQGEWLVARATAPSPEHPGFVLHKVWTFGAGPVWRSALEFENRGAEPRRFHTRRWIDGEGANTTNIMPLAAGLTRAPAAMFPGNPDDEMKRPEAFAERWTAREDGEITVGFVWGDDMAEFEWGQVLVSHDYDVPPQSYVRTRPLHWYTGEGDWRAVQRLYRQVSGASTSAGEPAAHLGIRLERPALVLDTPADAVLLAEHRLARPLAGDITLELPQGWSSEPAAARIEAATYRNPERTPLRISANAEPGAYLGRAVLRSNDLHASFDLPLIRLGDGRAVDVVEHEQHGQPVLTIDNGRLAIDVTPSFGGTLSALREGGVNHLASPFPQIGALGWMSPWYGGVMPAVVAREGDQFPGKLGRQRFSAEATEQRDEHGTVWRGVRQRTTFEHDDLDGLLVEFDTLTAGGSPVVKLVLRLHNPAPVSRPLHEAGWMIFVQPEGEPGHTAWTDRHQVRHSDRMVWLISTGFVAAESPRTGRALVLMSREELSLAGFGRAGTHLKLLPARPLVPANGSYTVAGYLVLARDMAEARRWAALNG
jgi:GNAT superfamily N-acetyltransferase